MSNTEVVCLLAYHKYSISDQLMGGPEQFSRHSDTLRAERSGGSNPVGGRDFPHPPRPVFRPTQPLIEWVPCLSRG